MPNTILVRGMQVLGRRDVGVLKRIDDASGEWGHLSVFFPEHRQHLAVFLGIVPEFDRFYAAWKVCGRPVAQLGQLGVNSVPLHNGISIRGEGDGGDLLMQLMETGDLPGECIVMGDPGSSLLMDASSIVRVERPLDISRLGMLLPVGYVAPVVENVCEGAHAQVDSGSSDSAECDSSVRSVVEVAGHGLMQAAIDADEEIAVDKFLDDMVRSGLPAESARLMRGLVAGVGDGKLSESAILDKEKELGVSCEQEPTGCMRPFAVDERKLTASSKRVRRKLIAAAARMGFGKYTNQLISECVRNDSDDGVVDDTFAGIEFVKAEGDDQEFHLVERGRDAGGGDGAGACHAVLTSVKLSDGPVKWADLISSGRLLEDEKLAGFAVVSARPAVWHVSEEPGGLNVLAIVKSARRAMDGGNKAFLVLGRMVCLDDVVGAVSEMSRVLCESLNTLHGSVLGELDEKGGRIAGFAAGLLSSDDKERVRVLQAVGDASLTLVLAMDVQDKGGTVQYYQEMRSRVTNNAYLTEKFSESKYVRCFQNIGSVVSPKTGGGAVEAMLGAVYNVGGIPAVIELVRELKLFT